MIYINRSWWGRPGWKPQAKKGFEDEISQNSYQHLNGIESYCSQSQLWSFFLRPKCPRSCEAEVQRGASKPNSQFIKTIMFVYAVRIYLVL